MKTFLRANVASITASGSDYLLMVLLVELAGVDPLPAGIAGTIAGGLVNFFICRHWAFGAADGPMTQQGKKYLLTWAGNLFLNAFGLYVLLHYTGTEYMLAKILTSLFVALAYNYPLQKKYVFKNI